MTASPTTTPLRPDTARRASLVALKVQRQKYATNAVDELELRRRIGNDEPASRFILDCAEVFTCDHHICQVYALQGRDTRFLLKRGPLPLNDVKILIKQVLQALKLMHSRGLTHSDIKPANILWCEQKKEACVIDFGNSATKLSTGSAIGTQQYCPPEMLLGNPMEPSVDIWALGCSIFEWLTGCCLFDPWETCCRKYEEFGSDNEDEDETSSPDHDDIDEEREQLPPCTVLMGKYRLLEEIGRGKCATVWKAEVLHDEPLRQAMPLREDARATTLKFRKPKPTPKGYDIYEVVQGYEHVLLMQELLGKFPERLITNAHYRHLFYDSDGNLRFDPQFKTISLKELLTGKHGFAAESAREIEAFLLGMLRFDPQERITAAEALSNDWLKEG